MGKYRLHRRARKDGCRLVARQWVTLATKLQIEPKLEVGSVRVDCGPPCILKEGDCLPPTHSGGTPAVIIYQELQVQVPLHYTARVSAQVQGSLAGPVQVDQGPLPDDSGSGSGSGSASGSGGPDWSGSDS